MPALRKRQDSDANSTSGASTGSSASRRGLGRGIRPPGEQKPPSLNDSGLSSNSIGYSSTKGSVTQEAVSTTASISLPSRTSSVSDPSDVRSQLADDSDGETQGLLPKDFVWSNVNCVTYDKKPDFSILQYKLRFEPELREVDKRLLFYFADPLKRKGHIDRVRPLYGAPDTLFTTKPISPTLTQVTSRYNQQQVITYIERVKEVDLGIFFDAFYAKLSLFMSTKTSFTPSYLLPSQNRFERHPGKVLEVLDMDGLLTRCQASCITEYGTIQDVIDECRLHMHVLNYPNDIFLRNVHHSVQDLIVMTHGSKETFVVKSIFENNGVIKVNARHPNERAIRVFDGKDLRIFGTRRSNLNNQQEDKVVPLIGKPATGQQRQLALNTFHSYAKKDKARALLEEWALHLNHTAVVSNDALLQSETHTSSANNLQMFLRRNKFIDRFSYTPVNSPVELSKWLVVFTENDQFIVDEMVETLMNDAPQIGIGIKPPMRMMIREETPETYRKRISAMVKDHDKIQLIMIVMKYRCLDVYRAIKSWALVGSDNPKPTQFVLRDTAKNIPNRRECSLSVITQMNCKLGGDLWRLDGSMRHFMVVGISGYTGEDGSEAYGFSSSRNKVFTEWYSHTIFDLGLELKEHLQKALDSYVETESSMTNPKTMFLLTFRMEALSKEYIKSIRSVFSGSLIIVAIEDASTFGEKLLTYAQNDDIKGMEAFQKQSLYIAQSNSGKLETMCCSILVNDKKYKKPAITKMINQLRHLYYNVAGETSLPAPVLYASKCAELVVDVLNKEQSPAVSKTLYFL